MALAYYDAFDFDQCSRYCGCCRYNHHKFSQNLGIPNTGYVVSRNLYATSNLTSPTSSRARGGIGCVASLPTRSATSPRPPTRSQPDWGGNTWWSRGGGWSMCRSSCTTMRQLEEVIGRLDKELKGKKFFAGDDVGYVDLVAGWMAFWLGVAEEVACFQVVSTKKFPRFAAWIDNFLQVPAIKQNLPPQDKTVEFFHSYRQAQLEAASK